jgi:hypothetical protein
MYTFSALLAFYTGEMKVGWKGKGEYVVGKARDDTISPVPAKIIDLKNSLTGSDEKGWRGMFEAEIPWPFVILRVAAH